MAGRLGRNLRQGHKAEGAGAEWLRPFCAVAPVPQTEDVGFDAVATLLRSDDELLYAEESFCVQFKAASVREIRLKDHEYEWIRRLKMPLFIGSVNLAAQEIALYSSHPIATKLDGQHFDSAVMHLDLEGFQREREREDRVAHEYLGSPALQWTAGQCEDHGFQDLACRVLKRWLVLTYANLGFRPVRIALGIQWQTNEVPVNAGTILFGGPSDLQNDLKAAMPYLDKLAFQLMVKKEPEPRAEFGLHRLHQWMLEMGQSDLTYSPMMLEWRLRQKYDLDNCYLQITYVEQKDQFMGSVPEPSPDKPASPTP
jgi:hypothetical protein